MAERSRRGRGEGSWERLPSGRFRAILSLGVLPGGKRDRTSKTFKTKQQALAWLRARQAEREAGTLARSGKITVGEWLAEWLAGHKSQVEPPTWESYRQEVESVIVPRLGPVALSGLEPRHVKRLYKELGESGASSSKVRRVGKTLRLALESAVEERLLASNVAKRVKLPRVRRPEIHPYTPSEVAQLLSAAKGRKVEPFLLLALDSGLRLGEMLALGWQHIDLVAGSVRVERTWQQTTGVRRLKQPKSERSRRTVLITPRTIAALEDHRANLERRGRLVEDIVFPSPSGGRYARNSMYKALTRLAERAGVPVRRPHDLRHTSASLLLSAGVNIKVISERLGHSNVRTTLDIYSHLMPGDDCRARDVMAGILGGGK